MTADGAEELARIPLVEDADVFTARQLGRDLAVALGLDRIDATRVATAISELAREAIGAGGGRLGFDVSPGGELVARVRTGDLSPDHPSIQAAQRLVERLDLERDDRGRLVVVLSQTSTSALSPDDVGRLRALVTRHVPPSPLEEVRSQHEELLAVLDAVRAKNVELETLNRELEETNRGVMALYAELSGELERTNQGVVALYAEIDDKNAQLSAASEAKSRFLRSISHELRTPVNSVLGLTRLLSDPGAGPLTAEQAEQVEFIRASACDLGTLVDELLDLAKAESGRLEPVAREVDVAGLFDDLRSMTIPLLRTDVSLVLAPVPDGLVVDTDPELVRHVLRNLLSNAAKFTEAGSVTLTVRRDDDGLVVSVVDTGVGMSEEDLSLVFEEFYQARTPLHATSKGSGLGLPFARRVARALGGDIDVVSTPGAGSTFSLRLPPHPPVPTS